MARTEPGWFECDLNISFQSSQDYDAIHIISHGNAEGFQLGSIWFSGTTVVDRSGELQQWNESLSQNADLLIFGCYVAATTRDKRGFVSWVPSWVWMLRRARISQGINPWRRLDSRILFRSKSSRVCSPPGKTHLNWHGTLAFTTNNDTASTPNNVPITVNVGSNDTGSRRFSISAPIERFCNLLRKQHHLHADRWLHGQHIHQLFGYRWHGRARALLETGWQRNRFHWH